MDKPAVRDAGLLILRVVLGVIFIAQGWQIFVITGITETTGQLSALGVPQPALTAWLLGIVQLIGGAMLVVGLLTTFVAGAAAVLVAAAVYFVAADFAFYSQQIASLLVIVIFGAGRASADRFISQ